MSCSTILRTTSQLLRSCWMYNHRQYYHASSSSLVLSSSVFHHHFHWNNSSRRRYLSFSFAGGRKLNDIIKKDMLEGKTAAEVSDIWYSYHETRDNVHGIILSGTDGKKILSRASKCQFFVQPIFRDDGFFMLMSQFQEPSYFLLAYLEDYKMDPAAAQPLMTMSVFDDYADDTELNLTLARVDIINKGISDIEGLRVANYLLDSYRNDNEYDAVRAFNGKPDTFDIDDFISVQNQKWKEEPGVSV